MPASEVAICNLALARIGVAQPIQSIDPPEDSTPAALCAVMFDDARDFVLADWPWPFALTTAAMTLQAEDPTPEWSFSYRRPADCLRVLRVPLGVRRGDAAPMAVGRDSAGGLIYCDVVDATLEYVQQVTDPVQFPPSFASALAWRLAWELAVPLSRTQELRAAAEAGYLRDLAKAQATAMSELTADPEQDSEFIRARA